VPPKAFQCRIKFQREGIRYADLSEDEQEHGTPRNGVKMALRQIALNPRR